MTRYLLAIDQGTTSTRAIVFDDQGKMITRSQKDITQYFPKEGWVEHDGMEIIQTVMDTVRQALSDMPAGCQPTALGITNQRETTIIWDRSTGIPLYNAIVWQDRRTADYCQTMMQAGHEGMIREKTGLLLDPYFSATKIKWILDHVAGARVRAERGELAFGTIDSFILWHLTKGAVHSTDVTNASRTMLYNIHDMAWDDDLLALFDIPRALLPTVHACDNHFGDSAKSLFGLTIPITAMAGDQQAAMMGQNCFSRGDVKCTFGTGGFIMVNTGGSPIRSQNRLLTTVAYKIQGTVAYALEGSFFNAGSAVQWLRDGLKIIKTAAETETLARSIDSSKGVYMVPAFTGLGAPHWNPMARGALLGLTRATGSAEIARATLESIGFQTSDLLEVLALDTGISFESLRVDGGMVGNAWLLQFLADIMQINIIRPQVVEITAYGIAMLSGIGAGVFEKVNEFSTLYHHNICKPTMVAKDTIEHRNNWKKAVATVCFNASNEPQNFE